MIYITNDMLDQAVYFELRKSEPRRRTGGVEHLFHGLVGNGVAETAVTIRSWCDCLEMAFGRSELFSFVEEQTVRRKLGEVVRELVLH